MGWSNKYKKSINCNNPKGFSQKAHCAGKKKRNETSMKLSEFKEAIRNVIRERSINAISKLQQKNIDEIQKALELYKKLKAKGDDKQVKKYVGVLKKLGDTKKKLEKEMDMKVSGMYKDAEYKGENTIINHDGKSAPYGSGYKKVSEDGKAESVNERLSKDKKINGKFYSFQGSHKFETKALIISKNEWNPRKYDTKVVKEKGKYSVYVRLKESVNESYDSKTGLFYLQGVPFTRERMKEIIGMMMKGSSKPNSKQFEYENQVVVKDKSSNKKVVIDSKNLNKIIVFYRKNSAKLASDKDF